MILCLPGDAALTCLNAMRKIKKIRQAADFF